MNAITIQQLGALIAPIANLIGGGNLGKIKAASDRLAQAVMAELPEHPATWQEIAAEADAVIAKGESILGEIDPK